MLTDSIYANEAPPKQKILRSIQERSVRSSTMTLGGVKEVDCHMFVTCCLIFCSLTCLRKLFLTKCPDTVNLIHTVYMTTVDII